MSKIISLLFVLIGSSASAQTVNIQQPDQTVQGLYNDCKEQVGSANQLLCLGYISGIGDALDFLGAYKTQGHEAGPFVMCSNATHGAWVQAFINWAEKNPKDWDKFRFAGVIVALGQTWPCK